MVGINKSKCTGCGTCVSICHEDCMYLIDNKVHIDYDFCSTCTQCIAICPSLALDWENNQPIPFDDNMLPSSKQLDELFKQRRTIRHFREDKPEKSLLEEIIAYGVYAPTHYHNFRVITVDDENLLNQIDNVVFAYNKKIYKYLFKPKLIPMLIRLIAPSYEQEYLKAKPKLEASLKVNRAYECMPPVILFIVGDKRVPLAVESAQYVLYNMDLYARTKGLGCRNLVGNQILLNKSKTIRTLFQLNKNEKIFATIGIGYPLKRFRNKVMGKKMKIQWNNESTGHD
jgi:nitroreductase/NAD-dependent dihydropyrimidine dehydrogenase PreA subunit